MIIRATSYQCTIKTPKDPTEYSRIIVTFQQQQHNVVTKTETELTIDNPNVIVNLTQEETAKFTADYPCLMQIRCYKEPYDAPGSMIWEIPVIPALDDRILGGEE